MKIAAWISAFRLRTLPLALSTVGMGTFLALQNSVFRTQVFIWAALTTTFLQVLSNLANDYGDTVNGADSNDRVGPQRAVQSGAISIAEIKVGIVIFVFLSFTSGIILLINSVGFGTEKFFWFLGFGLLSILAAYTYTAGKRPYGYAGLGDIMVLVFFGLLGVGGCYFLYSGSISSTIFLPALAMGALATGVLNINNMRDVESDQIAGKITIPVRLGMKKSIIYHWILLLSAVVLSGIYLIQSGLTPATFLWILGLPLILLNGLKVSQTTEARLLDPYLKQLALSTFLFMLLFGLALVL